MEMTICEIADSVQAYNCQHEEQCDDCFMIDHLKECGASITITLFVSSRSAPSQRLPFRRSLNRRSVGVYRKEDKLQSSPMFHKLPRMKTRRPHLFRLCGRLLLYRRGFDVRYGNGTADALEERYRDSHSKAKQRRSGTRSNTKPKSSRSKKVSRLVNVCSLKKPRLCRRNKRSVPPFALGQQRED